MRTLFQIAIGHDESTGYHILVHSLTDDKVLRIESISVGRTLKELDKSLRAKLKEIKNFPLPEPPPAESGLILAPNGQPASDPPKLEIVQP